jgi:hypothetical protein
MTAGANLSNNTVTFAASLLSGKNIPYARTAISGAARASLL